MEETQISHHREQSKIHASFELAVVVEEIAKTSVFDSKLGKTIKATTSATVFSRQISRFLVDLIKYTLSF